MDDTHLRIVADVAKAVNRARKVEDVLVELVSSVCRGPRWSTASVMAIDEAADESVLLARHDPIDRSGSLSKRSWELRTSPVLQVATSMTILTVTDARLADEFPTFKQDAKERGYRALALVPLENSDHLGRRVVMSLQSRNVIAVDDEERAFLLTVATIADLALEKAKQLREAHQSNETLERSMIFRERSFEVALRGDSTDTLLVEIDRYIGQPWLFFEALTGNITTSVQADFAAMSREALIAALDAGNATSQLQAIAGRLRVTEGVLGANLSLTMPSGQKIVPVLAVAIEVEGRLAAVFLIEQNPSRALNPFDTAMLSDIRYALGAGLLRDFYKARAEAVSRAEALFRLTRGEWINPATLTRQLTSVGIDIGKPNRLLSIAANFPNLDLGLLEAKAGALVQRLHMKVATALLDSTLLIVLPVSQDDRAATIVSERLVRELGASFGIRPAAALSGPCLQIDDYKNAFQASNRLLALMRSAGRSGVAQPVDVGADALLLAAASDRETQRAVHSILSAVSEADDEKLMDTVKAFVNNEGRFTDTALLLGIHISTLRYRLERLRERYSISIETSEERFLIRLALQLSQLVQRVGVNLDIPPDE